MCQEQVSTVNWTRPFSARALILQAINALRRNRGLATRDYLSVLVLVMHITNYFYITHHHLSYICDMNNITMIYKIIA